MPFWIWLILGFVLLSFLGMFAATWPIAKRCITTFSSGPGRKMDPRKQLSAQPGAYADV